MNPSAALHVSSLIQRKFDVAANGTPFNRLNVHTVSQAYFALHETLHKVQNFQENNIFWY
jgi:hypothetical protein